MPDDRLVLAAVERAVRHRADATPAAPIWSILAHLAITRRSAGGRHVRLRLAALVDAGELSCTRRHGANLWALTRQGEERLRKARDAGEPAPLPESPQHRAWRDARAVASEEIENFRQRLGELLEEAGTLLSAEPAADSDAWLELGEELRAACRLLGSATHCLYEWEEPDDASADIDGREAPDSPQRTAREAGLDARALARRRAMRAGRRNVGLWREHDGS
jgi:hypothetical protein